MNSNHPHPLEPFLTPVNKAGIPNANCFFPTLLTDFPPLPTPKLAKLYWILHTIDVNYSHTLNGTTFIRRFSINTPSPPRQRIISPPTFSHRELSPEETEIFFSLDFKMVSQPSPPSLKFAPSFTFQEKDDLPTFILTSSPSEYLYPISQKTAYFDGTPLPIFLYSTDPSPPGSINFFTFQTHFYAYPNH